jgi:hypothetical protein
MRRVRKKKKSQGSSLRLVAWVLALFVALLSLSFPHTRLGLFLELTAALIFAVGTVWPRTFRSVYTMLVMPLGRIAKRAWFF